MSEPVIEVGVLVGSLRRESVNRKLAAAMVDLVPDQLSFTEIALDGIPMYNGDLETSRPAAVAEFKDKINRYDGILMVMPEYNRSVPAVLKNAIDWGSKPPQANVWMDKPVALAGISPGAISTAVGQLHLRQVLGALGAAVLGGEAYLSTRSEPFCADGTLQASVQEFLRSYLTRFADFARRLRTLEALPMTNSQSTAARQFDERAFSALLACQQVIAESYARADADQRGSVADLFVEDGWQRLGPDEMNGREMIREVMGARDGTGRRTLHTVSDVRVAGTSSSDELHLSYNLTLYLLSSDNPCTPSALATVADVFVERNGQWLLKSRALSVLAANH